MTDRVQQLIAHYQMQSHPEGGWYLQTYQSPGRIQPDSLPAGFSGPRPFSTAIYFLLEEGNFSAFHRIKSDECWHFYEGQTLLIHMIDREGKLQTISLGNNFSRGEVYQYMVPAGYWFASEPAPGTAYSFVGCTVSPGFDFTDFELARGEMLAATYPAHQSVIHRLCR